PEVPSEWRDDPLAERWRRGRNVGRVVTGALEIERAHKRIGSSLEAAPRVFVLDPELFAALGGLGLAGGAGPPGAARVRGGGATRRVPARGRQGRRRRGWARAGKKMRALVEDFAERRL